MGDYLNMYGNLEWKTEIDMEPTCSVPVLLGLYDSPCPSLNCSPYENKIGGIPDFFPGCVPSSTPSCVRCGSVLVLLVQVYCPLESSVYHRLLHVYCCIQPSCRGRKESWLVLRSQLKDDTIATVSTDTTELIADGSGLFIASGWCDNADDWGSSEEKTTIASDTTESTLGLHQEMNKLSINEPTENIENPINTKPTKKDTNVTSISNSILHTGPYYPPSYLQVIEEPTTYVGAETTHAKHLLLKYQRENPDVEHTLLETCDEQSKQRGGKGGSKRKVSRKASHSEVEGYERVIARHGDRTFQKFQKQLAKCPQQLMRYSRGGNFHLITSNPAEQPPDTAQLRCQACGSPCVFEFQIMPTLVYVLQQSLSAENGLCKSHDINHCSHDHCDLSHDLSVMLKKESLVDFGTVLIYTCSMSCWEAGSLPRPETVFVQMDTDKLDCLL